MSILVNEFALASGHARRLLSRRRRRNAGRSRAIPHLSVQGMEDRLLMTSVIGAVTMPYTGMLSAAVYDSQGHFVKSLYQGEAEGIGTRVSLQWDGTDQNGNPVPNNQQYQWRAAFSQAKGVVEGDVGDSGYPPYGKTESGGGIEGVATDSSGNLYSISWWEESHDELRKYAPDGHTLWAISSVGGYGGIATDGTSVYVSISPSRNNGADRIYRYTASSGDPLNFTGTSTNYITVNTGRTESDDVFDYEPLRGLAVDSARLFVSDYHSNRVDVYDKSSGSLIGQFDLASPLGVAVQSEPTGSSPGVVWVVNSGNKISKYLYYYDNNKLSFIKSSVSIENLDKPNGAAIGGPDNHLFVTERSSVTNDVREYDVSGNVPAPAGLQVLGHLAAPGPVTDSGFRDARAVAVSPSGQVVVSDHGNRRMQTFNPDGTLLRSVFSEFLPTPFLPTETNSNIYNLTSAQFEYQIDATGSAHSGWMGDGTWRLVSNWQPADDQFDSNVAIRRTFTVNGARRDYIYYLGGNYAGAAIYQINADGKGFRRSAIVGSDWVGTDGTSPGADGRWVWTDSDGDGQVESSEVSWDVPQGRSSGVNPLGMGFWVDEEGAIWVASLAGQTVKVPLQGFDGYGNPRYDWSKRELVVDANGLKGLNPRTLRVASNGDIYEAGNPTYFVNGGHVVNRYDAGGNFLSQFVLANTEDAAGIAVSPDGNYWFAGENSSSSVYNNGGRFDGINWIDVYTNDNLRVATLKTNPGKDGPVGWFDNSMPLASFSINQELYVYAEEGFYGKSTRYRIDNLASIQRLNGAFAWPQNPTIVSVVATTPSALDQGQQPGVFTVSRTNSSGPLTVYYTLGGTAAQGGYQENLISTPSYSQGFDALSLGPITGQDGWAGGKGNVIQGEVSISGRSLKVAGGYDAGVGKPGIFAPTSKSPVQQVTFDFRLTSAIGDFVGVPGIIIQNKIMGAFGPDSNANNMFTLVYRGTTDSGGNVVGDRLELRGAGTSVVMNGVRKGIWYHVTMRLDFAGGTCSAVVQQGSAPVWVSGTVKGLSNGNTNILTASATSNPDAPFYLDNVQVIHGSTPAGEGSVTIPDGQTSATIAVTPQDDLLDSTGKTLVLRLLPDNSYAIGGAREAATVLTADRRFVPANGALDAEPPIGLESAPPTVSIVAAQSNASEQGHNPGVFTISRTGDTSGPLRIYYATGGTADVSDYSEPLSYQTNYSTTFDSLNGRPIGGRDRWIASTKVVVQDGVSLSGAALRVQADGLGSVTTRSNIFYPSNVAPRQRVSFDFRLGTTIASYLGAPGVDIQQGLMTARGPDANKNNAFYFTYKGITDSRGNIFQDVLRFSGNGAYFTFASPDPDAWYHAVIDCDFAAGTATLTLSRDGRVVWTSPVVTGMNNGNANALNMTADSTPATSFEIDRIVVDSTPTRGGVIVIPDGRSSATISITPSVVGDLVADRTVVVYLAPDPSYNIGPWTTATITITKYGRYLPLQSAEQPSRLSS